MSEGIEPPADDLPSGARPAVPRGPLPVWRVPLRTPLILLVVAIVCILWNFLSQPSIAIRAVTIILAVACLGSAALVRRTYLIVEPRGVAIRFVRHEEFLAWAEISGIEVIAGVRGAATVRFLCTDGTQVDVPPSLFQNGRQGSRAVAAKHLDQVATKLKTYWAAFGDGEPQRDVG